MRKKNFTTKTSHGMFWYFILGCVVVAMTVLCGKCVRMSRAMMMMREECIQHQQRALDKRFGPGGAGFPHGNPQAQLAAMSRLLFLCDQLSKHPELATSKTIFEEVTSVANGSGLCSGNKAMLTCPSIRCVTTYVHCVVCIAWFALRGLHCVVCIALRGCMHRYMGGYEVFCTATKEFLFLYFWIRFCGMRNGISMMDLVGWTMAETDKRSCACTSGLRR